MHDLSVYPAFSRTRKGRSILPAGAVILLAALAVPTCAVSADQATESGQAGAHKNALPAQDCAPADRELPQVKIDPEFTEQVMQQLASDKPSERTQALSQLSVKRPPVDPVLLEDLLYQALNDPDAYVRGQAVYAMAKQDNVEYLSVLQQALADPELQVRLMVLDGLDQNEWSRLLLEQAQQDNDEAVREFATGKLAASTPR
ncbi:MAG: HEAT repeat domain-containing protein [Nitrosomonas sp.]|nr:HEAT repeat domain-containing protein [Nitrosomonas sp.]